MVAMSFKFPPQLAAATVFGEGGQQRNSEQLQLSTFQTCNFQVIADTELGELVQNICRPYWHLRISWLEIAWLLQLRSMAAPWSKLSATIFQGHQDTVIDQIF